MKATFEIDITGTEILSELERTAMEITAFADNIAFLLNNSMSPDVVESEALKAYQKKQVEAKLYYENKKRELEKTYIPDYMYNKYRYDWNLTFWTGIITVTVYDNTAIKLLKDHGVKLIQ